MTASRRAVSDDGRRRRIGYRALEIHQNRAHILAMTTVQKTSPPKLVRDSRTGKMLEVRGYGALKGRLKIMPGIDLTKPIYEQVIKKTAAKTPAHKR